MLKRKKYEEKAYLNDETFYDANENSVEIAKTIIMNLAFINIINLMGVDRLKISFKLGHDGK